MKPVMINGDLWNIRLVHPDDPSLIDRTGMLRVATTDWYENTINVSDALVPPLLDMVILHEVTHAITISHGLLRILRQYIPDDLQVLVEEWSTELVEKYSPEAIAITNEILGRPICIREYCIISN